MKATSASLPSYLRRLHNRKSNAFLGITEGENICTMVLGVEVKLNIFNLYTHRNTTELFGDVFSVSP